MHPVEGICVGCYRNLDEIAAWGSLSSEKQQAILDELPFRKSSLKKRRGSRHKAGI